MEVKPGYKQTEIGVIPEDWEIVPLSSCCDVRDGTHESPKYHSNGIPLVTSKNIVDGKLDLKDVSFISELDADMIDARSKVDTGDLLLSMIGTVGNVTKVDVADRFCIKNVALIKPRQVTGDYLLHLLRSDYFSMTIQSKLAGGIQKFISLGMLRSLYISIMSDHEQNKISETLSDIDLLITTLEKLIEKKKLIKQGVMQELLTGKRRLPGFRREWETKRYGDIFQFISSANYTREDLTDTGSIRYIHYGDIHTKFENYVDLSDALIPTIQDCKLKNYPLLETGDLIMVDASEDYSGVGKSVEVINSNGCKAISGLHTILLRDTSKTFADGYRAFIHSIPSVKAQLDFYATGMKVYSISKGNLARIEIPVPPKDEQEAIVNTLGRFVDEIKGLDIRLAKCKLLKQAMMQELLTGRIRLI